MGNSLVVQWSGLLAFTAEGLGSIPGWGTKMLQGGKKKRWQKRKEYNNRNVVVFSSVHINYCTQKINFRHKGETSELLKYLIRSQTENMLQLPQICPQSSARTNLCQACNLLGKMGNRQLSHFFLLCVKSSSVIFLSYELKDQSRFMIYVS